MPRFQPRPYQSSIRTSGGPVTTIRLPQGGGGLAGSYRRAMEKANRANKRRYGKILKGYDSLHGRVMGQVGQFGQQQRRDIDESYRDMEARGYQNLVNRGFGNSSLPATMRMGYQRERQEALGRLNAQLAQQYANYDTGITQGKLGVMERRNDVGPDYNQLIALSQGLGQAGPYGAMGGGPSYGFGFGGPMGNFANAFNAARMRHLMMAGFFNPMIGRVPAQNPANLRLRQAVRGG